MRHELRESLHLNEYDGFFYDLFTLDRNAALLCSAGVRTKKNQKIAELMQHLTPRKSNELLKSNGKDELKNTVFYVKKCVKKTKLVPEFISSGKIFY